MAKDCELLRGQPADRSGSGAVIRDAALRRFAAQGVAATTLRLIASDAGVSLGLVQHRFGTKERLVEAVDQYVLEVVQSQLAFNASHDRDAAGEESVEDTGGRVRHLITEYPEVVDYMARAMVDETPLGTRAFDALFAMGRQRWSLRAEQHQLQPDVVDVTWATLNPMLLTLGAIILRRHVERQLPEPFTTPTQLRRWAASVSSLLQGLMR
jgi:AcrR family transcriptional regulator